ncbi:MAG: VWA-like domain-containing protein [Clostridia bacterium]|nr:VWA-like domain-containing protein [Clostridia bacterium]
MDQFIREMRSDIEDTKALLFLQAPFLAILLSKMRILVNKNVRSLMVTPDGEAIFNPEFWSKLDGPEKKAFILLHEALHLAFRHPWLIKDGDRKLYNMATDMVINEMLFRHGFNHAPGNPVTAVLIQVLVRDSGMVVGLDELRRLSSEEVYRLLNNPKVEVNLERNIQDEPDDVSEPPSEHQDSEVVQGGAMSEGEDPEEFWRATVAEAAITVHQAGVLPGDIKRQVDLSLKAQVSWRRQIRGSVQEGAGRMVVSTWHRSSRRYASFPGIKRLGVQTVWALIDCSGSIPDEVLAQFVTEVWSVSRVYSCDLKVIPWDAQAHPVVQARTAVQARRKIPAALKGGGGTLLGPALRELGGRIRMQDIVIILSDGYIADIEAKQTLDLYRRITRRAARVVFVTTGKTPPLPTTRFIHLEHEPQRRSG